MTPREDDTFRATRYGGHPPACTCVACCEKRRAGISTGTRSREGSGTPAWFWAIIIIVVAAIVLTLILN